MCRLLADLSLPDQIAQRLRAAGVAATPAKRVECSQQIVVYCDSDALHDRTFRR